MIRLLPFCPVFLVLLLAACQRSGAHVYEREDTSRQTVRDDFTFCRIQTARKDLDACNTDRIIDRCMTGKGHSRDDDSVEACS